MSTTLTVGESEVVTLNATGTNLEEVVCPAGSVSIYLYARSTEARVYLGDYTDDAAEDTDFALTIGASAFRSIPVPGSLGGTRPTTQDRSIFLAGSNDAEVECYISGDEDVP